MSEEDWLSQLGKDTRNIIGDVYKGLPIDEQNFRFFHTPPKQFSGFSRHSRNIIYFQNMHIMKI